MTNTGQNKRFEFHEAVLSSFRKNVLDSRSLAAVFVPVEDGNGVLANTKDLSSEIKGLDVGKALRKAEKELTPFIMTPRGKPAIAIVPVIETDVIVAICIVYCIERAAPKQELELIGDCLRVLLDRNLQAGEASDEASPADLLKSFPNFGGMIGQSKQIKDVFKMIEKVAKTDATVLVQGENGTGKEMIARSIYKSSKRKSKKYIEVNCGALSENLLSSELFGHIKGSFTGADRDKVGLFEEASGGTLFLDEIGDTPPSMQVKLLRVLQEGVFTPVGSTELRRCDVRIVAATNKDLRAMIAQGLFREDLFYRLNVFNLAVPALRDRADDIDLLVKFFMAKYGRPDQPVSQDSMSILRRFRWPGNVRQLDNEVQRMQIMAGSDEVLPEHLSDHIRDAVNLDSESSSGVDEELSSSDSSEQKEKEEIVSTLAKVKGNLSQLARELGMSRSSLIRKMTRLGIDRPSQKKNKDAG